MEIDKLKIPAFQRKKTIRVKKSKGTSFKASDPLETRQRVRLKKANITSIRRNRKMDVDMPPIANEARPISSTDMPIWRKMSEVGEVTHFFEKIDVAVLNLQKSIKVGDRIIIESPKGLFEQELSSMQIDRKDVRQAKKGDDVGMKVKFAPKIGGLVYKVVAEG